MHDPVRIGVVGLGNFGRLHAQTLTGLGEAQLAGLVDQRPEALAAAEVEFTGVPVWNSLSKPSTSATPRLGWSPAPPRRMCQ